VDELRWAGLREHLVAAGAVVLRVGPGDAPIDPDAAAELWMDSLRMVDVWRSAPGDLDMMRRATRTAQ
jgi:hypothetical protein